MGAFPSGKTRKDSGSSFLTAEAIGPSCTSRHFSRDRGGLRDSLDGHVSFADIVYFTFITVTSVGYGDIVPVTTTARLIDALFVTPVRLFVWIIFLGTAYQFVAQKIIEEFRMRLRQSRLTGHVVICGYGLSGRSTAAELLRRGENPAHIVVIDRSEDALLEAAEFRQHARVHGEPRGHGNERGEIGRGAFECQDEHAGIGCPKSHG